MEKNHPEFNFKEWTWKNHHYTKIATKKNQCTFILFSATQFSD